MAITSIKHKALKRLFETGSGKGLDTKLIDKLNDMLTAIDAAHDVEEIGLFPGWRLHELKGDYAGFYSLTVTGNLRLIFKFEDEDASELDLLDYH